MTQDLLSLLEFIWLMYSQTYVGVLALVLLIAALIVAFIERNG